MVEERDIPVPREEALDEIRKAIDVVLLWGEVDGCPFPFHDVRDGVLEVVRLRHLSAFRDAEQVADGGIDSLRDGDVELLEAERLAHAYERDGSGPRGGLHDGSLRRQSSVRLEFPEQCQIDAVVMASERVVAFPLDADGVSVRHLSRILHERRVAYERVHIFVSAYPCRCQRHGHLYSQK